MSGLAGHSRSLAKRLPTLGGRIRQRAPFPAKMALPSSRWWKLGSGCLMVQAMDEDVLCIVYEARMWRAD